MSNYSTWRKDLKERGLWTKRAKYQHELERLRKKNPGNETVRGEPAEDKPVRRGKAKTPQVSARSVTKQAAQAASDRQNLIAALTEAKSQLEALNEQEAEILSTLAASIGNL